MCESDGPAPSDPCHSCFERTERYESGRPVRSIDPLGELSPVGAIMMTREEVVLEAQDESEVAWYDHAVERTGPFTREAWEYSRWVHCHIVDLPAEERTRFFEIEHARRESKWN